MCGITGILRFDDQFVDESTLVRFNNSQAHRGPDGCNIWISEDHKIGLGHRRLSILDLSSAASQPMSDQENRYHITYNGEVFNFLEIKKELENDGMSFKTDSDTEVIINAYKKWGEKCLSRFNGMWAFAIWDSVEQTLFLARDRFGIKPLHILFIPDSILAFASETIAFKNLNHYSRAIDELNLTEVLINTFSLEGKSKTIYKDIQQLPAGHFCFIKFSDLKIKFFRWWNTINNLSTPPSTLNNQIKEFRELLLDSCKLRMRSDVSLATALSGGMDSSSIYSFVKNLSNLNQITERVPKDSQKAFVATFPGASNDEKKYAEQVVSYLKGQAVYTIPNNTHISDHIISTTKLFDSIYISPISVAVDIYSEMHKNGYKVSMDGHGVDEMLFGYPHMLSFAFDLTNEKTDQFLRSDISQTYLELFNENNKPKPLGLKITSNQLKSQQTLRDKVKKLLPNSLLDRYRKIRYGVPIAPNIQIPSSDWLKFRTQISSAEIEYLGFEKLDPFNKIPFREFHSTTLPTILRNFDRASMQSGVEIRMPFMDYRLVQFVFSLPFSSKVGEGYTKLILRKAMADMLPKEIIERKNKVGFNAPMPNWFSNELKPFILDEINSTGFTNSAVWDSKIIKTFVETRMKNGWTWHDCNRFWPYLNAHIVTNK